MKMRAKLKLHSIAKFSDDCETLNFSAVCKSEGYPSDGSDENNTFAKWTPSADLKLCVTNPALVGAFKVGEEFYVDFTPVEK